MAKSALISTILENHTIVDYLESKGYAPARSMGHRLKYSCPLHGPEKVPSFYVFTNKEYQYYHCFSCIESSEPIWNQSGLTSIGSIQVGDSVIDRFGDWQKVLATKKQTKPLLAISTEAFQVPLKLTPDHTCIYAKKEEVLEWLPYIHARTDKHWKSLRFSARNKKMPRSKRFKSKLKFYEGPASEVKVDDFFVFPKIAVENRVVKELTGYKVREYTSGPRVSRIRSLPVTPGLARVYGFYLAEGSYSGRCLKFTLNIKEKNWAEEIQQTILRELGVVSTVQLYPDRNTCCLDVSKVDLGEQLSFHFGKGAVGKKLPSEVLNWPVEFQEALFSGYSDGDGCKRNGGCTSVSFELAFGMFALLIQMGKIPRLQYYSPHVGKDGTAHLGFYLVHPRKEEAISGFWEKVDGTDYYFSRVDSVEDAGSGEVVDISVANTESFVTKLGVVHNCRSHGDIINLVVAMESLTIKDAIGKLARGLNINAEDITDRLADEIEDSYNKTDLTIEDIALRLSRSVHGYLESTGFDPIEVAFMEKVLQKTDRMVLALDLHDLQVSYDKIVDEGIAARTITYLKRKEQEEAAKYGRTTVYAS